MRRDYLDLWNNLWQLESQLMRATGLSVRDRLESFYSSKVERPDMALVGRLTFGFDLNGFRASDYLIRYPFSSDDRLLDRLRELVDKGYLDETQDGLFKVNGNGHALVTNHQEIIADGMTDLDLGENTGEGIQYLLQVDRFIVERVIEAVAEYPRPILAQRLRGLHPDYDQPRLWHHWQYTWTLIAAREDAENHIRALRGITPMEWFARKHLMTQRFKVESVGDLVKVVARYIPVKDIEDAVTVGLNCLVYRGWAAHSDGKYCLTEKGMSSYREDEAGVSGAFLSTWPELELGELERMNVLTSRILARLRGLIV